IVDLKREAIAVREANRLGIPVIGLVDTNCDPDEATYVIPGNDDAIRSCNLILGALAAGILEGRGSTQPAPAPRAAPHPAPAPPRAPGPGPPTPASGTPGATRRPPAQGAPPRPPPPRPRGWASEGAPAADRTGGQGPSGAHRRGDDGLQGRPDRGRRGHRGGR